MGYHSTGLGINKSLRDLFPMGLAEFDPSQFVFPSHIPNPEDQEDDQTENQNGDDPHRQQE